MGSSILTPGVLEGVHMTLLVNEHTLLSMVPLLDCSSL